MAERGWPADLDTLGTVITEHPDLEIRYLAVALLGDIPDDRAVLAIERGLGDQDPLFRSHVVATLGINEMPDAVRSLGYVIFGESDPGIRSLAVRNLSLRDDEPAREFLAAAARDPHPLVRRAAANALKSLF
jgi:HEAT repeat protein